MQPKDMQPKDMQPKGIQPKDTQTDPWDTPILIEAYGDPDPPCLGSFAEFKRRVWEFLVRWKSILCL